jgi:hypothetical protein
MFDQWDDTPRTGSDTEYTLVVLGLCIGAAYSVVRLILECPVPAIVAERFPDKVRSRDHLPRAIRNGFFVVPIPLGSPGLPLRI